MPLREFHYRWEFDLESSPEQLWPLVADTNRFNRDTGVPEVEAVSAKGTRLGNARRRMRLFFLGMAVEWEEQPFEWTRPQKFGVVRRYTKGPITELRVLAELNPRNPRGTKLVYQLWAQPRNVLGLVIIPIQIGFISARNFAKTFREYDELARQGRTVAILPCRARRDNQAGGGRYHTHTGCGNPLPIIDRDGIGSSCWTGTRETGLPRWSRKHGTDVASDSARNSPRWIP